MSVHELEKRLELHGKVVRCTMAAPFDDAREVYCVKKNYKKLISLMAAAAVLACLATAFAAGGLGGWSSFRSTEFESVNDGALISEELGFAPVLIESFENGYAYASGQSVDNSVTEDDGSVKEQFKSAFFVYEKDGDEVWFSQDASESVNVEKGRLAATVDGTDIYYYSYENKAVPEDYQKTPEDIAAEERGELILSWGSDSVRQYTVQSVEWRSGNIACCLMQMDGALSEAELIAMAKECLAAG